MDLTVLIVGLLIGIGIPLRNKAVREYQKKGNRSTNIKDRQKRKMIRQTANNGSVITGSERITCPLPVFLCTRVPVSKN